MKRSLCPTSLASLAIISENPPQMVNMYQTNAIWCMNSHARPGPVIMGAIKCWTTLPYGVSARAWCAAAPATRLRSFGAPRWSSFNKLHFVRSSRQSRYQLLWRHSQQLTLPFIVAFVYRQAIIVSILFRSICNHRPSASALRRIARPQESQRCTLEPTRQWTQSSQ